MAGTSSIEVKVYNGVYSALLSSGFSVQTSRQYAGFAVDVYVYVKDHPKLQAALAGLKGTNDIRKEANSAVVAYGYAQRATNVGLETSALRFAGRGNASVGGALGGFVDYCAALAKLRGIEMNECAISVTKVMLDVLTVVALTETVVGVWAAAMQALSTANDTKGMIDACFKQG